MHICSIDLLYLQGLRLASWTNLRAEMAFLRHVPLCSPFVWKSPPQRRATSEQCWHHILCGHDSPNSWACAVLQIQVYHDVQGMWSCGKPCTGYSEPHFWSACEALHFPDYLLTNHAQCAIGPRLFSRQLRDLCAGACEDQVIFQGNLFSRLCLSPETQLVFAASNLLKRPPCPLFH